MIALSNNRNKIMAFAITIDHNPDETANPGTNANAKGVVGPRSTTKTFDEIVNHPDGQKFRMLDDDREVYYEGVFVGEDEFQPLDCFGSPNAGCTTIQYWQAGTGGGWKDL